jgi:hypothetical protein
MTRIEVVTYDVGTGLAVVDHTWKVVKHGKRQVAKALRRAHKWARKAAEADHSTDHVVYVRGV